MNHQPTKERLWTKDYITIIAASAGVSFCNYFFFTALPLYAAKISGVNIYGGLMLTAYSLSALIARPVSGMLSDRIGRVRMLIMGAAICAGACALYGLTASIALLLAIRVINGLGFGMFSTNSGAAAADVIPPSRLAEGIGYYGLYGTVASAFAPFVALTVVGDGEIASFHKLFYLSAGICLVSMILGATISYERKTRRAQKAQVVTDVPKEQPDTTPLPKTFLGFEYTVFLPAAVMILNFFAVSSINTFLPLLAKDRGFGNIGLFFTVSSVGLLVSRILLGRTTDRRGTDIVVIPGLLGLMVCLGVIPFIQSSVGLFLIALPIGLCNGAVMPAMNSLVFKRCSPQRRGTASAAFFSSIDIGFSLGGFVFGFVADVSGYNWIYWIAAILMALSFILYMATIATSKPRFLTRKSRAA